MDAAGQDPWAEFRITQPAACQSLLRELCDGLVPVVLNAADGSAVPTVLRSADAQARRLVFSADTAMPALDRLVECNEAAAIAYIDQVKVQCHLEGFLLVHGAQGPSLISGWPDAIYRFQRRQAFRVRHSGSEQAEVLFRHPSLPEMALRLRLLDISIGGCALWLPADVPPLQPGTQLGEIQVNLGDDARFEVPATLQHATAIGRSDGVRIGCAWGPLPGQAERVLQRWIDRAQQRHRLLQARS
jgi:c-di-GMP-binding flagellar brake protein YcgR